MQPQCSPGVVIGVIPAGKLTKHAVRRILAGGALCALVVVALIKWPKDREPEYQGKTLTAWLNQMLACRKGYTAPRSWYGTHEEVGKFWEGEKQARLALKHIGTNALPSLVKWSSYKRPAWRSWLIARAASGRPAWEANFCRQLIYAGGAEGHVDLAGNGFLALEEAAEPAIPEVMKLMESSDSRVVERAAWMLKLTRGPGYCALAIVMTNRSFPKASRLEAARVLAAPSVFPIGEEVTNTVPALLVACEDENAEIHEIANLCLSYAWWRQDWSMR